MTANKNFLKKVVDIRGSLWYYNNCQEERELATLLTHISLARVAPEFQKNRGNRKVVKTLLTKTAGARTQVEYNTIRIPPQYKKAS